MGSWSLVRGEWVGNDGGGENGMKLEGCKDGRRGDIVAEERGGSTEANECNYRIDSGRKLMDMSEDERCSAGQYARTDERVCHYWW